jgi:hypothetical protein
MVTQVRRAWDDARKRNQAQNVPQPKFRDTFTKRRVEDSKRGASVQMPPDPFRMGKPPQNLDGE